MWDCQHMCMHVPALSGCNAKSLCHSACRTTELSWACVCLQILAPNDDAFDQLLTNLGGGQRLPVSALFKLPELNSILSYHIIPGQYTSGKPAAHGHSKHAVNKKRLLAWVRHKHLMALHSARWLNA